jgi:hypothetical protein
MISHRIDGYEFLGAILHDARDEFVEFFLMTRWQHGGAGFHCENDVNVKLCICVCHVLTGRPYGAPNDLRAIL